ncbi:MAG: C-GCAxxG-C-C family (seleno)protein [Thermovirgaceae bacterium]|nr:C-GCAxxG-C-C family (seleno)protein [Thermovirgaceae bacterium]
MLIDRARRYYFFEDMNCAETILCAANDEYGLGLDATGLKTMAGFGGGMGVETTCGALAGAVAAISVRFTKTKAHEDPIVKDLCKKLMEKFVEEHGSMMCTPLKELYRDERFRCMPVIDRAVAVLEKVMNEAVTRTLSLRSGTL